MSVQPNFKRQTKNFESFAYTVSHDLRAPLRGIDGFSTILLEDYSDKLDEEGKRILNIIKQSTTKMGHLIDDLLSFSRLGKLGIVKSDIAMKTIANSIYFDVTSEKEKENISFILADLPRVMGDTAMIRQVWFNLITNAVKFTSKKDNPTIEVGYKLDEGGTVYFIKDNGVGFDMKHSNKLFNVFQRLHSGTEFEGSGVGLAIVKAIVAKHGGSVWAESEIDVGSCFYFRLTPSGNSV